MATIAKWQEVTTVNFSVGNAKTKSLNFDHSQDGHQMELNAQQICINEFIERFC